MDIRVEVRVVDLVIVAVVVPVAAPREEVGARERIDEPSGSRLVRDVLIDVLGREIDLHVVAEQIETHLRVERVLRVVVLGGDALRGDVPVGEVGAEVLRTAVDRHRVVGRPARAEELLCIVLRPAVEPCTPAVGVVGRTVGGLEFGKRERRLDGRVARDAHRDAPGRGRFRGDHDGAVGGDRSVERGGRGPLEQRDRGDVVGVDRREGVAAVAFAAVVALHLVRRGIHHQRHAIDHHQRLVRSADRLVAAEEDLRRTAGSGRVGGDLQTRRLALQRVDHVDRLDVGDIFAADRLGRIGKRLRLTLDAHGRHDDGVHAGGGLLKAYAHLGLALPGDRLRVVAHIGDLDHIPRAQPVEEELPVHVGGGTPLGPHDHGGRPDQRTRGIRHDTLAAALLRTGRQRQGSVL